MNQKINIINDMIQINGSRYINIKNVVLVSKILNGNKSKLAFNFENIVSIKNKNLFVPEFHYVFEDQDIINDLFSLLSFKLKDKGFVSVDSQGNQKLVNKNKINSFYVDEDNISVFLNLNSSINGADESDKGNVISLSVKCVYNDINEVKNLVNQITGGNK